jgi:hypothetical protein
MRKAFFALIVTAACLPVLWLGSTSASAGFAGVLSSTAQVAHQSNGVATVNHWRRGYRGYYGWGGPAYYPNYYYAPYGYAVYPPVAYYTPPAVYYAPVPRYYPPVGYSPYDGYAVRYRHRYYDGW